MQKSNSNCKYFMFAFVQIEFVVMYHIFYKNNGKRSETTRDQYCPFFSNKMV